MGGWLRFGKARRLRPTVMGWALFSIGLLGVLGGLLLAAGLEDVRTREIANAKTAAIALLAPLWWHANGLGWGDVTVQVGVAAAVFALFVGAFALRQMGGGDVKLIGALALWLPPGPLAAMLVAMVLAGGAITLAILIEHRWRRRLSGGAGRMIEVPYGGAIAIAGLLAIREPIFNQIT